MDDILINLSRAVDYRKIEVQVRKIDFDTIKSEIETKELPDVPGVKINWKIIEKAPFHSDPKLVKVILNKTISNAMNYRQGSKNDYCNVVITTDSHGAVVAIEDNGVGISNKVKTSIFEMFVKGTNKSKGAGLGLYLVKIALDKLKGKVTVESEVNKGSKLIFQLPNLV
ncbi:MAG: HAMP domain-containing histidine kinase [Flavobacteriales bacterium]|nr:HAMP domain-containing histidine kinase [Flavobacteriales bacterium]